MSLERQFPHQPDGGHSGCGGHSQFSSVAQLCPTLCDPMDGSTPGFSVLRCLLEFAQTHVHQVGDAIQPSHPLSSPSPPAFNSIRVFSDESALRIKVKPNHQGWTSLVVWPPGLTCQWTGRQPCTLSPGHSPAQPLHLVCVSTGGDITGSSSSLARGRCPTAADTER